MSENNEQYYSSPETVINYTGVHPEDLGLDDQAELEDTIRGWLVDIKDLIDQDRNRDFHKEVENGRWEKVPPAIDSIALKMASNMVAQAITRRDTPIIKIGEYAVRMVEDKVFTSNIKDELKRFPYKPEISFVIPKESEGE